MDSRLFMEIGVVNTTFQAVDATPYERWINEGTFDSSHAVLQRLVSVKDGDSNKVVNQSVTVADTLEKLKNVWEVENIVDGLYYYQKLVLPTTGHTTNANETLWYDGYNVIYYDLDEDTTTTYSVTNDFDDIYDLVRKEYPDNCFYFDDYTFTIYSLVECYVLLERDRINTYLKNNCRDTCNNTSILNTNADILLAAITIINALIERKDFFEAQRILNGIRTCKGLCPKKTNPLNNCGCGDSY